MNLTFEIVSSWAYGWIATVLLFTFIHFFIIEVYKDRPVYWHWALIRLFFCGMYYLPFHYLSFWEWLTIAVFQITSHFVIFNPLLNKLRSIFFRSKFPFAAKYDHYPFFYLGKQSGWVDKTFLKLGPGFHKVMYYICSVVMVLSIVTIFIRYVN